VNPQEIHERLVVKGHEKARAAAYYSTTDRIRKEVRAKWIVHYIGKDFGVSMSEHKSILEPEYIKAAERCENAQEESGKAAVEYAAAEAFLDVWRTMESTKRAEMQAERMVT